MTADTIYDDFYNEWWRPNDDYVDFVDFDDKKLPLFVAFDRHNRLWRHKNHVTNVHFKYDDFMVTWWIKHDDSWSRDK